MIALLLMKLRGEMRELTGRFRFDRCGRAGDDEDKGRLDKSTQIHQVATLNEGSCGFKIQADTSAAHHVTQLFSHIWLVIPERLVFVAEQPVRPNCPPRLGSRTETTNLVRSAPQSSGNKLLFCVTPNSHIRTRRYQSPPNLRLK